MSTPKPYQTLGIGDTEHLGRIVGHTFVFPHRPSDFGHEQQAAWPGIFGRSSPLRMLVVGDKARLDFFAKQGFLESAAALQMTADQCAQLAATLLRAAMEMEEAKAAQMGGAA